MAASDRTSISRLSCFQAQLRTSKAALCVMLDEIPAFDRLLQYRYYGIMKDRVAPQVICGNCDRVEILHYSDET